LTFLVRGDLGWKLRCARERRSARRSPDNCPLVQETVAPNPDSWRVHVFDLQTNVERIVAAETRYIDDHQVMA
jgi:hypothetical protein